MIEVSRDLFEADLYGELLLEKVQKFVKAYLIRCQIVQSNPCLDILFYGRMYYP